MGVIEAVPVVQSGGARPNGAPAGALPAVQQPASVVAALMLDADVLAQARQAIPPTPAALLDISPEAAGLINPVVSLTDNTQLLLLGEQTLELIGTSPAHPHAAVARTPAAAPLPLPSDRKLNATV
jgi:hypothetical protein